MKLKSILKNVNLIVHIHELNGVIRIFEPYLRNKSFEIDKFICVSELVRQNLIMNYEIEESKTQVVYEFIDVYKNHYLLEKKRTNYFKVGSSGFVDWRKGYDLFILTAYQFKKKFPEIEIHFQWIGYVPNETLIIIDEDIKKLGMSSSINFSGKSKTPMKEFNELDIFLLLSREDPFPLVCLEVGSLGKPIICFEKASGICELIEDGGGVIVPYLDIEEVVNSIYQYHKNRVKLLEDSENLKNKIFNYDSNILAPKIFEIIVEQMKSIQL